MFEEFSSRTFKGCFELMERYGVKGEIVQAWVEVRQRLTHVIRVKVE